MKKFTQYFRVKHLWPKRVITLCALLLAAHGVSLFAGSGEVVDEATMKPLAGAFVYARWESQGWNPVQSATVCYHFAITQTDEKGKFTLPTFSWNPLHPFGGNRYVGYYFAGYELSPRHAHGLSTVLMRRVTNSSTERLEQIVRGSPEGCMSPSDYKKYLVPLYRAKYEEARRIAITPSEKKIAASIKYGLDFAEVAPADGKDIIIEGIRKP